MAKEASVPKIPKSDKFSVSIPTPKLDFSKEATAKQKAAMKRALSRGIQRGVGRVETSLSQALDKALSDSTWGWTGTVTRRKNGQTVTSPRNIVDTGYLRDSKVIKVSYLQTKSNIEIKYKAPYANLVHFGGMIRPYGVAGRQLVSLPPRPWITAVLQGGYGIEKFDVDSIINEAIQEAWTEQFG